MGYTKGNHFKTLSHEQQPASSLPAGRSNRRENERGTDRLYFVLRFYPSVIVRVRLFFMWTKPSLATAVASRDNVSDVAAPASVSSSSPCPLFFQRTRGFCVTVDKHPIRKLGKNDIVSLPEDIFDGLDSLTELWVNFSSSRLGYELLTDICLLVYGAG